MEEIFYKVQREDGLFYNPNRPAKTQCGYNFDKDGKRYFSKKHAENCVKALGSTVNVSWFPHRPQTPIPCVIKTYKATIVEIPNEQA